MVKLNKIYTRTGDDGTTGLATGARVSKDSLRVEAYGDVDEANAAIGVAVAACRSAATTNAARIAAALEQLQHDMFDLGADLATPIAQNEKAGTRLRMVPAQTDRLEPIIDEFNQFLAPLNSFVLPGGSPQAAALHVARTAVRRAERTAVSLKKTEPTETGQEPIRYLNRLSDLLFVMARFANDEGRTDVLWLPGANRTA